LAASAPERVAAAVSSAAVLSPAPAASIFVAEPPASISPPEALSLQPPVAVKTALATIVRPAVHDHFDEGAQKRWWICDFPEESVRRSKGIR
jgi:hypothetical protein